MGKLQLFQIATNKAVFQAGEMIEGVVTVQLNDSMKMRGIRLQFNGQGYVHWTERHTRGTGDKRRTETVHYRASENYFNQEIMLFGPQPGQSDHPILPPGRYDYPFRFQLPMNLPSSFEGAHGHVRYSLKGTIDKPWKFDHTAKAMITVLSVLDLNQIPDSRLALHGTKSKTLCCLCCKSGPITAEIRTDRKGYVPGECITVEGEVENLSSREMSYSKLILKQSTIFRARNKTRTVTREVASVVKGKINPGQTESWNGEKMHVPPLPPSSLIYCNIIDVNYVLQLETSPSGPSFDLDVVMPITIGTIPLQGIFQPWYNAPAGNFGQPGMPQPGMPQPGMPQPGMPQPGMPQLPPAQPSAPPMGAPPVQPSAPVPPPPTYHECVFGKVDAHEEGDTQYTQGDLNWAPSYTYYSWDNQQQAPPQGNDPLKFGSAFDYGTKQ